MCNSAASFVFKSIVVVLVFFLTQSRQTEKIKLWVVMKDDRVIRGTGHFIFLYLCCIVPFFQWPLEMLQQQNLMGPKSIFSKDSKEMIKTFREADRTTVAWNMIHSKSLYCWFFTSGVLVNYKNDNSQKNTRKKLTPRIFNIITNIIISFKCYYITSMTLQCRKCCFVSVHSDWLHTEAWWGMWHHCTCSMSPLLRKSEKF